MKRLLKGPWIVLVVVAAFMLLTSCATAPPAKEEAKAAPAKEEAKKEAAPPAAQMKWTSDADGVAKDGVFTRTAAPAFVLEYPADFKKGKLEGNEIVRITGPGGLPVFNVEVQKVPGDVKELLQGFAEGYAKSLEDLGTDVEIIYNKPLPEDTYGEEFPAQEFEIEWMYAGSTLLTSYINVVIKEGYSISLQGHVMGDIDELKAIFETIDLEP